MANLTNIVVRYYAPGGTQFNHIRANEPLQDLFRMINLVNDDVVDVSAHVASARGSKDNFADRLDVSLNADGSIKTSGITGLPTSSIEEDSSSPYDPSDKVFFTRGERSKLSGIKDGANRFLLRTNRSEAVDGLVTLMTGDLIKISQVTTSDGETRLIIDTTFSPDDLHSHRYGVVCSNYSNGIAAIPEDDDPIAGSVRVYVNGVRLRRSAFVEYYRSGKVVGVQVKESPGDYDLSVDDIEFDYEVRSARATRRPAIDTKRLLLDRDVAPDDLVAIYLPENSGNQTPFYYWLIDISDVPQDLSETILFVTAYNASAESLGGTFRRYGHDWDVVSIGGARYIRWRYQESSQTSENPDVEDKYANYLFLTQSGYGTSEDPQTNMSPTDLAVGMRVSLFV